MTPRHETLAEQIYDAVRALPLTAGLRGVHAIPWTEIRALAPLEAERYRSAADVAFLAFRAPLPGKRARALARRRSPQ